MGISGQSPAQRRKVTALAVAIVVVVVVAGVGAYLALSVTPGATSTSTSQSSSTTSPAISTTSSPQTATSSSSTAQSSSSSSSTSSTSSASSTSTTSSASSSSSVGAFAFYFQLNTPPVQVLVQPGGYTQVTSLTIYHSLSATGEFVYLNSTSPTGITVSFFPASPVTLPASKNLNVSLRISASKTVSPGNYTIQLKGVSGTFYQTASLNAKVVHNIVFMVRSTFSPMIMNITTGSTVVWQDLDGPAAGCGLTTTAVSHNVVFTTLTGANSPTMKQFDVYNYTFTAAGTYFYYSSLDTDHLMNGTIVVTAGGNPAGMSPSKTTTSTGAGGASTALPYETAMTGSTTLAAATPTTARATAGYWTRTALTDATQALLVIGLGELEPAPQ